MGSKLARGQYDTMRQELRSSSEKIGKLYPVLIDYYGNIIDGEHRSIGHKKWKKVRLEHIKKDEDRLVARIISNNVRRRAPRKGKEKMLGSQGQIYLMEGIEPRKIAYRIAEETGMGYQWVTKYLSDRCRDACAHCAGKDLYYAQ